MLDGGWGREPEWRPERSSRRARRPRRGRGGGLSLLIWIVAAVSALKAGVLTSAVLSGDSHLSLTLACLAALAALPVACLIVRELEVVDLRVRNGVVELRTSGVGGVRRRFPIEEIERVSLRGPRRGRTTHWLLKLRHSRLVYRVDPASESCDADALASVLQGQRPLIS